MPALLRRVSHKAAGEALDGGFRITEITHLKEPSVAEASYLSSGKKSIEITKKRPWCD
jgi:hypothetical protein